MGGRTVPRGVRDRGSHGRRTFPVAGRAAGRDPACRTVPGVGTLSAMTASPRTWLLLAGLVLACAPRKQAWRETTPPETFVELLPKGAELSVDGASLGPGGRTLAVPDPAHVYVLRATAPGFSAAERSEQGARLAGGRIGLALRPEGFGDARRLDFDDGVGLAAAAALLEKKGRHELALEYADRAVELAPEHALGHRVAGDAALALGRRKRAIQAYSTYLSVAPDAPDRVVIERRVEGMRGDLTIPPQVR